jgi:acyl dehydratase
MRPRLATVDPAVAYGRRNVGHANMKSPDLEDTAPMSSNASHEVVARNWSTQSENKIHDDTVARRFGFAGGLVPGVALYAYLARPVAESWGERWLRGGRMDARFVSPVYDGTAVTSTLSGNGALALTDATGHVCVTGSAALPGATAPADGTPDIPDVAPPIHRPSADADTLAPGTVLGAVEHRHTRTVAGAYLDQIDDRLWLFRTAGFAHPGWLLRGANEVLVANVVLGPWIHVESRVRFLRPVMIGQTVRTRARVASRYDHKGHQFVELDVVALCDDGPAMWARHVAIYRPRQVVG